MPGTSLRTNYFVQHKERTLTVPQISRFRGIIITMYYADPERHPVPHFHVRFAEYEASVMIDPPTWLAGLMPRRQLQIVLGWAELRQIELLNNWQRLNDGEPLQEIDGI